MKKAFSILCGIIAVMTGMLLSGCSTAPVAVKEVKFLGSIWNPSHDTASIISQDGGLSFAVPGGTLWAFGDTFLGKRDKHGLPHFAGGTISCSIAFLPERDKLFPPALRYKVGPDGIAISPLALLPGEKKGTHMIWPQGGIYVNEKSYLYYSLIQKTGTGTWDFKGVGSGLACSQNPLGQYGCVQIRAGAFRLSPLKL